GNLLLESGDAHRALETFRDLLTRQPETATREDRNRSRLGMASALLQLGRPSEARAPLAAMETPEPEPEAQRELLLARAALLDRDIPGALQSIERARHLAPQDSQIGVVHSRILYLSGREEAA
ncbi:tetratricopeptide repeat protein, partial [Arthrospira platensis SPKY1]|nr:tetratricopeptide repeat protein [Arthrospira platensis SPKY1]